MKSSLAGLVYFGSMGLIWWSVKRMARLLDRPYLWDSADGIMGAITGIAYYPLALPLVVWNPLKDISTAPELFALRNAAIVAFGMTIAFVYLSIFVEKEIGWQDVPESLEPIEDRFWKHQMCWVPWSPVHGVAQPSWEWLPRRARVGGER